jgi:hypothetical protein
MDDSMDDLRKLDEADGEDGDRRWRPKDDGSERLSPFLGLVGETTILEDAEVTYRMKPMKESMDDFVGGLRVRWTKLPLKQRATARVTTAEVASD